METPQASNAPPQTTHPTSGNKAIHVLNVDHNAVPSTSRDIKAFPRPPLPTKNSQTQYVAPAPAPAGLFAHQATPIVVQPVVQPVLRPPFEGVYGTVLGGGHSRTEAVTAVAPIALPQERPVTATTAAVEAVAAVAPWNIHVPLNPVVIIAQRPERIEVNPARPVEPPAQMDDERPGPSAPREGPVERLQTHMATVQNLVKEVVS